MGNPLQEGENKFWDFIPGTGDKPPELLLYGYIRSYQTEDEDEVTLNRFSKELDALGDVPEIIVRINSGGGDVFTANAIFIRLKNHSAKITVKIDGWAASAATIIAMAGDNVQIARNSVFMIHDPSMIVIGSFQAEDFEKMSGELKVVKQSIINAYWMKTKKDTGEIAELMAQETWMTGDKAVEEGFCDELMLEETQVETMDGTKVNVNGIEMDISSFRNFPKNLLNGWGNRGDQITNSNVTPNKRNEEETEVANGRKIETVEDLKAEYPQLVAAIQNEAQEQERGRIRAIEDMAKGNYKDIVFDAKFEHPCTAEQAAVKIVQENNRITEQQIKDTEKDIEDSGVNDVPGAAGQAGEKTKNEFEAAIDQLKFE